MSSNTYEDSNFDEFFSEDNFYSSCNTGNSSQHIKKVRESVLIPHSLSTRSIKDGLNGTINTKGNGANSSKNARGLSSLNNRTSIIKSSPSLKALESILNEKSKSQLSPKPLVNETLEEEEEDEEKEEYVKRNKNENGNGNGNGNEKEVGLVKQEKVEFPPRKSQVSKTQVSLPPPPQTKTAQTVLAAPVSFKNLNKTNDTLTSLQTFETATESLDSLSPKKQLHQQHLHNNEQNSVRSHHATKSMVSTISGSGYSTDDTPILQQPPTLQTFVPHSFDSPLLKVVETGSAPAYDTSASAGATVSPTSPLPPLPLPQQQQQQQQQQQHLPNKDDHTWIDDSTISYMDESHDTIGKNSDGEKQKSNFARTNNSHSDAVTETGVSLKNKNDKNGAQKKFTNPTNNPTITTNSNTDTTVGLTNINSLSPPNKLLDGADNSLPTQLSNTNTATNHFSTSLAAPNSASSTTNTSFKTKPRGTFTLLSRAETPAPRTTTSADSEKTTLGNSSSQTFTLHLRDKPLPAVVHHSSKSRRDSYQSEEFDPEVDYTRKFSTTLEAKTNTSPSQPKTSMTGSSTTVGKFNEYNGNTLSSNAKSQQNPTITNASPRMPNNRSNSTFSLNLTKKSKGNGSVLDTRSAPPLLKKRSATMDDLSKVSMQNGAKQPEEKKKFSFKSLFKSKSKNHSLSKETGNSSPAKQKTFASKSVSSTNIPVESNGGEENYKWGNSQFVPATGTNAANAANAGNSSNSTNTANNVDASVDGDGDGDDEHLPPLAKTKSNTSIMNVFRKNKSFDQLDKMSNKALKNSNDINLNGSKSKLQHSNNKNNIISKNAKIDANVKQNSAASPIAKPGSINYIREVSENSITPIPKISLDGRISTSSLDDFADADAMSFEKSNDEENFDIYDSKNLTHDPPKKRAMGTSYGEEILLVQPLIDSTQFGSPFKVNYHSNSPEHRKQKTGVLTSNSGGNNSNTLNNDNNSISGKNNNNDRDRMVRVSRPPRTRPLSSTPSPNPNRYPSLKDHGSQNSKVQLLVGETLFPRSLSAHEVESIVSLERSRSIRSVKSNKRSSFVNYDGSDDNIIQYNGPVSSPQNTSIGRTNSILRNSISMSNVNNEETEDSLIDANILQLSPFPNYLEARGESEGKSEGKLEKEELKGNTGDDKVLDLLDYDQFMEFSEFLDVENLNFNYSPSQIRSVTSSPKAAIDLKPSSRKISELLQDADADVDVDVDVDVKAVGRGDMLASSNATNPNAKLVSALTPEPQEVVENLVGTPSIVVTETFEPLHINPLTLTTSEREMTQPFPTLVAFDSRTPSPSPLSMERNESPKTSVEVVDEGTSDVEETSQQRKGLKATETADDYYINKDELSNESPQIEIQNSPTEEEIAKSKTSPIFNTALQTNDARKFNNRPISMSFKGFTPPTFSGKIAQHDLRSSDSHQSFNVSFTDDDASVGAGFGTTSEDEDDEDEIDNFEFGDENNFLKDYEKENTAPYKRPLPRQGSSQESHITQLQQLQYQEPLLRTPPSKNPSKFDNEHITSNNLSMIQPQPPFGQKFLHNKIPSISDQSSTNSSPRSITSFIGKWKKGYQSQGQFPRPAPPPPTVRPSSKETGVRFSSRIILYDTYNGDEYDRHPDTATCNQLTPLLAQQIKEEMNLIKLEMDVHVDSRCYTQFF